MGTTDNTLANDNIKVDYAIDWKINDQWHPASQTDLTFDRAVNAARIMWAKGHTVRIMAWTQEDGYWLVAIYQ